MACTYATVLDLNLSKVNNVADDGIAFSVRQNDIRPPHLQVALDPRYREGIGKVLADHYITFVSIP